MTLICTVTSVWIWRILWAQQNDSSKVAVDSELLSWLTCEREKVGERERAEWIRGKEESSGREHINKLHFTHFSPHPAGIWRAPEKPLLGTGVSWLHTDTHATHTNKHTLPRSPCLLLPPSLIDSLTTFSFLMVHLSAECFAFSMQMSFVSIRLYAAL